MPTFDIPPVMTHPGHLAPGDVWEHRCELRIKSADGARSRLCMVDTQGGIEGLKAHIRTVHG